MPKTANEHDTVYDLIADHAAAWARFGRAVSLVDKVVAKAEGREITKGDLAEYEAANDAEEQAYRALLSYVPSQTVAVRAKVYWIKMHIDMGNRLQEDEVDLLLGSMIETRAQRAAS